MKKIFLPVLIIMCAVIAQSYAQSADQIMRTYYDLPKPDTQVATSTMVLREADGSKITRIMQTYIRETNQGTDNFMEFISPADVSGTRFLTIGDDDGPDDQRLWLPALGRTRKIASSDKGGNFMGSDLSYYDMGTRSFSDATYKIAGEETLTVIMDGVEKQTECWVIECTYINPECPYEKALSWISKDNNYIYKSKIWDENGDELKDIYIVETVEIDNVITQVKIIVSNVNGHKTLMLMSDLQVNTGIDPDIFTIQNLER
jgi:hypothetical protein